MRTWIIGSGADCDVVVAQPRVSGRHCRFTELADGFLVEDLGSSNGTYVNGERIVEPTRVSASERITLGAIVVMPWPPASGVPGATVIRIGRVTDNDVVLDDPRVSSHHARLLVSEARTLIEDTGSANGTFVNSPEQRVTQAIPLADTDTVYFGSLAVPAARLLPARRPPERAIPAPPPIPAVLTPPLAPSPSAPPIEVAWISPWTILMLAQVPVIAILILLVCGRQAAAAVTAETWPAVAESIASTTFALAVSAVWLGGSLAVWTSLVGRPSSSRGDSLEATALASPGARFTALGALGVAQCAVLLGIVHWGSALRGPWVPEFGILLLAGAVGLSLGWAVFSLIRDSMIGVGVLSLAVLAMMVLGGRILPVSAFRPAAPLAAAMPTRWAFEGLLLLESERHPASEFPERSSADRADDLAEDFFPAESDRMGPKADAMALGFMMIGLAATGAVISANGRPGH